MKTAAIIILVFWLGFGFGEPVKDPMQDYLKNPRIEPWFAPKEDSAILKMEADSDGDGRNEIFLSRAGLVNGQQGNLWNVYTPKENKFYFAGQCDFHQKAFYIGKFDNKGRGLVTYGRGGPKRGVLTYITLSEGRIKEEVLRSIAPGENEEDKKLYGSLFFHDDMPQIEKIPLEVARQDMKEKLER